jgi:chromosome segregation ATPase
LDDIRSALREVDELSRRVATLKNNLAELDRQMTELSERIPPLTRTLDKPSQSALQLTAEELIGAADTILEFARGAARARARTDLQRKQLAESWSDLWLNLRRKFYKLAEYIDTI